MNDTGTMTLDIAVTGTSPLLMHNPRLADPFDPIVKEMATYTKKRSKMTEEDTAVVNRLEWVGGLYLDGGVIVLPTSHFRASFISTGRATREGKNVERAIFFSEQWAVLNFEGSDEIGDFMELYDNPDFVSRLPVNISQKKIFRVRPKLFPWWTKVNAIVNTSIMNVEDASRIIRMAGLIEGVGDYRKGSYGRFSVEITEAEHVRF